MFNQTFGTMTTRITLTINIKSKKYITVSGEYIHCKLWGIIETLKITKQP